MRAQRHQGGGNVDGLSDILDQTDMIEPGIVADRNDQGIMGLIGLGAIGRDIALDQRHAGILAEPKHRAREHGGRRSTTGDVDDLQRLLQHCAIGDLDHQAVGHHGAV